MKKNNTDKEYILQILTILEKKREVAAGLKILITKNIINEKQILELLHIFLKIAYSTETKKNLQALHKQYL